MIVGAIGGTVVGIVAWLAVAGTRPGGLGEFLDNTGKIGWEKQDMIYLTRLGRDKITAISNDLAPTRRKVIIWTNDGEVTDTYASLGLNELRKNSPKKWATIELAPVYRER